MGSYSRKRYATESASFPKSASSAPGSYSYPTFADLPASGSTPGNTAFVVATNKLYIWSGVGWYLIATVTNASPTAITGVSDTYVLAIDGTATTITAVSTDPEGFSLTWSYAVSSGSLGSTATVSQADNVFTITPSTNSAHEGTFSLTFSVTDGINGVVSAVSSFTLAFSVTNSRYTSLSVKATATGSNQTFDDASASNHTITVAGDTTTSTFSPYRHGGYSFYFGPAMASNYIRTNSAHADFAFGTGDFTIEFWIYKNDSGSWRVIVDAGYSGNYSIWSNQSDILEYYVGSSVKTSTATALLPNIWTHVALVRNSAVSQFYMNGVASGSAVSDTVNYSGTNYFWVPSDYNSNLYSVNGYYSDVRVVKGTAVYTSNFTPPTEPLTAITNTKFLLGQLPYLKDQSTSNHALITAGDVSLKPKSVFDNSPYSEASHGASAYFDGTGDRLTIAGNSDFAFGTGDFSISCWIYFKDLTTSGYESIIDARNSGTDTGAWQFGINSNAGNALKIMFSIQSSGSAMTPILISNTDTIINRWYYISVSRTGTTSKLHLNGTEVASNASDSTNYSVVPASIHAGSTWSGTHRLNGYLSDIRVVKGTGLSDYTTPTAPLTAVTNTKFLLNPETSISDLSQSSAIRCVGDAATSTTQVKFAGTKSIYLDGTGDYVQMNNVEDSWISGYTGDYTIEFWWYPTNVSVGSYQEILTAGVGFQLYIFNGGGLSLAISDDNTTPYFWGPTEFHTMVNNTWQHIAVVRNGNVYTVYVDGVSKATTTTSSLINTGTDPIQLGIASGSLYPAVGYFQDLRVTKGLARYTSGFTPPTAELEG